MQQNKLPASMTVGQFMQPYSAAPDLADRSHPEQVDAHMTTGPDGGPISPETALAVAAQARRTAAKWNFLGNATAAATNAKVAEQMTRYALDMWKRHASPTDLRQGLGHWENGRMTAANPARVGAVGPNGEKGTNLVLRDGSIVPNSLQAEGLPPGEDIQIKGLATDFTSPEEGKKLNANYGTLTQLDQLQRAADMVNQNRNFLNTGAGADMRTQVANGINTALQTIGLPTLIDPTNIALQQAIAKNAFKLSTESLASQFGGSREAGFIIMKALQAVPNGEQNPMAFNLVLNAYRQASVREIDLHNYKQYWSDTHHGDLRGAQEAFNQQNPWDKYSERAWSQVFPVEVPKGVDPKSRLMPGAQFRTPDMPAGIALRVPGPSMWVRPDQAAPVTSPGWPSQQQAGAQ